ncbi:MAG: hypothetical protein ACREC0_09850 [Methylocella sp.]
MLDMVTSPEDVLAFLRPHLTGATGPDQIAKIMAPLALDSAWAYLGGSGSRQQIFQLDGNTRAVFQFGAADNLVAYGAYHDNKPWERKPAGANVSPVSGSDVSLILVTGKSL